MEKILIKSNLFDYEVEFINNIKDVLDRFKEENCVYVIDRNVFNLYQLQFASILDEDIFLIDAEEKNKNLDTIMELIQFWKEKKVKKNWKVICFGGGITQDITTFASNIYLRNIEWYFFPTTLLAMSDSCIGGKCGINMGELKNQLGVFYPPKKIFICDMFLQTLSEADYLNGWGELLKFSLTEDSKFYEELTKEKQYIPCKRIDEYIYSGLNVKKNIIEIDEFEGDLRRILNYGHTFGHALEAYTKNLIPHGKAVIWGIDVVNYLAYKEKVLDKNTYEKVKKLIKDAFINEEIVIDDAKAFFGILSTDKKVKNNTLYFAFLDRISHLIIYPMELNDDLEKKFEAYLEETHEYYSN